MRQPPQLTVRQVVDLFKKLGSEPLVVESAKS